VENLLSTKQLQELLNIDRTTVYRMLKDGRLTGIKVGNQWRFPREEVDAILAGEHFSAHEATTSAKLTVNIDALPLNCIQKMQDVFAEVLEIGAITTAPSGKPLTKVSNPCQFCQLILDTESGNQACSDSWTRLAAKNTPQTEFDVCHAGLLYARKRININNQFKAMFVVGQFYATRPSPTEESRRIKKLAEQHNIDESRLKEAAQLLPVLNHRAQSHIIDWVSKEVKTIEMIGNERAELVEMLKANRTGKVAS
jgi:excisionase family DNA binding protein